MKDEYTFENESENEAAYTISNDFVENDESPVNATTSSFSQEDIDRHRNIKCGIINTIVSLGINSVPIIVSAIKNKKSGIPVKIDKGDIVKAAVSTAFPILETVDAAFLGNKLTNKYHLKDVRNVTNIAITYPAAHRALNEFVNKTIRVEILAVEDLISCVVVNYIINVGFDFLVFTLVIDENPVVFAFLNCGIRTMEVLDVVKFFFGYSLIQVVY